jgi:hypothetical protein
MPFDISFPAIFHACILAACFYVILSHLLNHPKVRSFLSKEPVEKGNTARQTSTPKTTLSSQTGNSTLARFNVISNAPLDATVARDDTSLNRGLNKIFAHVLTEFAPGNYDTPGTDTGSADENEECGHFWQQVLV